MKLKSFLLAGTFVPALALLPAVSIVLPMSADVAQAQAPAVDPKKKPPAKPAAAAAPQTRGGAATTCAGCTETRCRSATAGSAATGRASARSGAPQARTRCAQACRCTARRAKARRGAAEAGSCCAGTDRHSRRSAGCETRTDRRTGNATGGSVRNLSARCCTNFTGISAATLGWPAAWWPRRTTRSTSSRCAGNRSACAGCSGACSGRRRRTGSAAVRATRQAGAGGKASRAAAAGRGGSRPWQPAGSGRGCCTGGSRNRSSRDTRKRASRG